MVCSAPTLLAGDTEPTRARMQMTASDLYPWGSGNVRERPEQTVRQAWALARLCSVSWTLLVLTGTGGTPRGGLVKVGSPPWKFGTGFEHCQAAVPTATNVIRSAQPHRDRQQRAANQRAELPPICSSPRVEPGRSSLGLAHRHRPEILHLSIHPSNPSALHSSHPSLIHLPVEPPASLLLDFTRSRPPQPDKHLNSQLTIAGVSSTSCAASQLCDNCGPGSSVQDAQQVGRCRLCCLSPVRSFPGATVRTSSRAGRRRRTCHLRSRSPNHAGRPCSWPAVPRV
jgi:hypothetical protein